MSTFERRFRLDVMPSLPITRSVQIHQVYWRLGADWSIRIREEDDPQDYKHTITIKGPRSGSGRPEVRASIFDGITPDNRAENLATLHQFLGSGKNHSVDKTRHLCTDAGIEWEIDQFHGRHTDLLIAEVHSQDEAFINSITTPKWAQYEVTADPTYNNENLAYEEDPAWIRGV